MANTKTTLEVPVSDLQPGMYVSELDRPWLGTPYLIQGILIRSQQDIDELARHCTRVHVDLDKSEPFAIPKRDVAPRGPHDAPTPRTRFHGTERYADARSAEEELPAAGEAHETASRMIDQIRRCNGRLPPAEGGAPGARKKEPSGYLTASMCQSGGVETTTNGKEGS